MATIMQIFRSAFLGIIVGCACGSSPAEDDPTLNPDATPMQVTVGSTVFTAKLFDNPTAQAFSERLSLTLNMRDVNANEKFIELSSSLPTSASKPGRIQSGDIMLYGSDGLVLFYKSLSTSYSYTRIGRIDDASGLEAALGAGNVTVTFEL